MNIAALLRFVPLIDPIMNKFSVRYRMHYKLINALENLLMVVKDLEEDQSPALSAWKRQEIEQASKVLAEAQGF